MIDKIDIVYLWVDGGDKKWRAEKDKWYKKITGQTPIYSGAAGAERYRDNGELLYSLRSVSENLPWVNHIYIVTGFNQVPKWLNTKNSKITIIPHTEIMPADALPTFNATAIEMCIPNIPNLSEHFILMNDDMFINKKISPACFFDNRGRAIVRYNTPHNRQRNIARWMEKSDKYIQTLILSCKMIADAYGKKYYWARPSHGIDPYIKSSWLECRNHPLFNRQIDEQIRNKFRTNNEIQRWMMNLYDLAHGRAKFVHTRAHKHGRHKVLDAIYNFIFYFKTRNSNVYVSNVCGQRKHLMQSATFCINDSPDNTAQQLRENKEFLAERFPNKCEFEK